MKKDKRVKWKGEKVFVIFKMNERAGKMDEEILKYIQDNIYFIIKETDPRLYEDDEWFDEISVFVRMNN